MTKEDLKRDKMNNVPKLRFKEFSGEWEEKKLKSITNKIGSGSTPKGGEKVYKNSGVPFIRSQNVNNNKLIFDDVTYIDKKTHTNMKNSCVKANDILLNITGASIGRSCVVPKTFEEGNVNQHVCIIRLKDNYKSTFLQFFLTSYNGQKLVSQGQTGSGREGINFQSIGAFHISIPSKQEQEKIASFLTSVDAKIEQLTQKVKLLKGYKKGVMQRIFNQEIRFRSDDGSEFCEWEEKNGNEIFEPISNKNHNSDLPVLAISQEFGAIPREMIDYQITVTEKSVSTYKVVDIGDYIISLRSFQGGIEYSNYKGICSPAYIILRPFIEVNRYFYKLYFKTDRYIKLLNRNIEGIRDGKMISYKQFSDIKLPYPSIEEQTKIANFLSSIDAKIEQTQKQLNQTKEFKKALLQQMFV
ncbi:MAG: restriction endonuclease subunit S [Campylobacterales bacterium]|nr:restriction endonuclease subunit S [Campylobacterales bacterium]